MLINSLIVSCLTLFISWGLSAQTVSDFFYLEKKKKEVPILVRGNLVNNKILLYVSGSYGDNAIDFARSDYPKWKYTLEKEVAIAYYDKRGLNKKVRNINRSKISYDQNSEDIMTIVSVLKTKYNADVYLMGHSAGGMQVFHYLSKFNYLEDSRIKAAIVLNTPFTNDSSPNRYLYYRPLYLKNLAQEFIEKDVDSSKWQQAYDWMVKTDSIYSIETSRKWNEYVDSAFSPTKRKISARMAFKVIFKRPYNPIKYLYNKDNDLVGDLLWEERQLLSDEQFGHNLSKINHTLLVITGRYDAIAIPEEMTPIGKYLKHEEIVVLPNCGHESFIDQPEILNKLILEFINDN